MVQAYFLTHVDEKLALVDTSQKIKPIVIDFIADKKLYDRQPQRLKHTLARALRINKQNSLKIIDMTAGFGADAFVLAYLGANVTLCERNALLHQLLDDALQRLRQAYPHYQINLVHADACQFLKTNGATFDAAYIDPMFQDINENALPKAKAQVLRDLIGKTTDDSDLLKSALACHIKRIVVKRPIKSDFLAQLKPHHQIMDKNVRFDVYC